VARAETKHATPGFNLFSVEQDIEIGRQSAREADRQLPMLRDRNVDRYLNKIVSKLAAKTPGARYPYAIKAVNASEINAFSLPGGPMYVNRGLVEAARSEAELAGVLAHEIAHVVRRHHVLAIKKGAQAELLTDLANDAIRQKGGDPKLAKLVSAGTEVYARGLDKNDEFEADRMGVVIAARGGYDPYGLPAVLQTLQSLNPSDSSLALMFKTHPALGDRLDLLDEEMSDQFAGLENQPDLADRFFQALGAGKK
jgi:predicted Zn-dependent protease